MNFQDFFQLAGLITAIAACIAYAVKAKDLQNYDSARDFITKYTNSYPEE